MSSKICGILHCDTRLLGFDYRVYVLDNDKSVAVCKKCQYQIEQLRKKK